MEGVVDSGQRARSALSIDYAVYTVYCLLYTSRLYGHPRIPYGRNTLFLELLHFELPHAYLNVQHLVQLVQVYTSTVSRHALTNLPE